MLGTHSEPRRGQMSHICDISPVRVNAPYFSSVEFLKVFDNISKLIVFVLSLPILF